MAVAVVEVGVVHQPALAVLWLAQVQPCGSLANLNILQSSLVHCIVTLGFVLPSVVAPRACWLGHRCCVSMHALGRPALKLRTLAGITLIWTRGQYLLNGSVVQRPI